MRTPATIPEAQHHTVEVRGLKLHYVSAGRVGSPIVLVHGFPESWWAFRKVLPLLARTHRVFAIDLQGFGDSDAGDNDLDSSALAETLLEVIRSLEVGPVHLAGQDVSGAVVYRLAANHPEDVLSLTAIETGLPGFGAEALADPTHGGVWYIGALVAPGVPELLFAGREREFIADYLYPLYGVAEPALTGGDVDEFVRTYARPNGLRGAAGLYASMLSDAEDIRALATDHPLVGPVLAVGSSGGSFTIDTMRQVTAGAVEDVRLDDVGHYIAQQAPDRLASIIGEFVDRVDAP